MSQGLAQWDERHNANAGSPISPPASIVTELLPLLPHGSALDVACGTGRHTLLLVRRGWHVTAVDGSRVALERLAETAKQENIPTCELPGLEQTPAGVFPGIDLVRADLEGTPLPQNRFDVVVCTQYLQRTLFPQFVAALRAGGMLLIETYTRAQLQFAGGPRNPEYLLERGELRQAFPELHTVFSRELCAGQGIASLLACKRGS